MKSGIVSAATSQLASEQICAVLSPLRSGAAARSSATPLTAVTCWPAVPLVSERPTARKRAIDLVSPGLSVRRALKPTKFDCWPAAASGIEKGSRWKSPTPLKPANGAGVPSTTADGLLTLTPLPSGDANAAQASSVPIALSPLELAATTPFTSLACPTAPPKETSTVTSCSPVLEKLSRKRP